MSLTSRKGEHRTRRTLFSLIQSQPNDDAADFAAAAGDGRRDGPRGRGRRRADADAHGGGRPPPRPPQRRQVQKRQRPFRRRTPQVDTLGSPE